MPRPVPSVEKRPYMVLRPHGEPIYRASFKSAQDLVRKHLDSFKERFLALNVQDSLAAISALEDQVDRLPQEGGVVAGVVDPYTGIKYRAEVVKRVDTTS